MPVLNFMRWRKPAMIFSFLMLLGSTVLLITRGLEYGLDFTGGTQIELGYPGPVDPGEVRELFEQAGLKNPVVVNFGSEADIMIKLQENLSVAAEGEEQAQTSLNQRILELVGADVEIRRIDYVGPQVGEELKNDGVLGMLMAMLLVMFYVAVRFQYKFSIGAVLALAHDVLVTLGLFSLFRLEVDLTVLAAVLAVIGYSLNDTIVVFDRIRENLRLIRKAPTVEVINISLSQTFIRTQITSLTTLLVLFALLIAGGQLIHNFALALIIGVVIGTYSSIYVAVGILLTMDLQREDLLPTVKEGAAEFDGLP